MDCSVITDKCEWYNETGQNFVQEAPYIDIEVTDVNVCLAKCRTTIPNCYSVRYAKKELSCRYSHFEYGDADLDFNKDVDTFMLKCPGKYSVFIYPCTCIYTAVRLYIVVPHSAIFNSTI